MLDGARKFHTNAVWNAGGQYYDIDVLIPLNKTSNIFREINFPAAINWDITQWFNFKNDQTIGTGYCPLNLKNVVGTTNAVTDIANAAQCKIAIRDYVRLYYRDITPNLPLLKKMKDAYDRHFTKEIAFIMTANALDKTIAGSTSNAQINHNNIFTSIVNPQRLYLLAYDPATNAMNSPAGPGFCFVDPTLFNLDSFQVKLNGKPYFDDLFEKDSEFYEEAIACTSTYGFSDETESLLNRNVWYKSNRMYVFDISRIITMKPDNTYNIDVVAINKGQASATNLNMIYLLDYLVRYRLTFTKDGVQFEEITGINSHRPSALLN